MQVPLAPDSLLVGKLRKRDVFPLTESGLFLTPVDLAFITGVVRKCAFN